MCSRVDLTQTMCNTISTTILCQCSSIGLSEVGTCLRINPCITVGEVEVGYEVVTFRTACIEAVSELRTIDNLIAKRVVEEDVEIESLP